MAIIPQKKLFGWKEIEDLGDLERLWLVLTYIPDEKLMRVVEKGRGKGRNDYPVRAVWNSILVGVVYEHQSVQSLRRELERNGQLRELCCKRVKSSTWVLGIQQVFEESDETRGRDRSDV